MRDRTKQRELRKKEKTATGTAGNKEHVWTKRFDRIQCSFADADKRKS